MRSPSGENPMTPRDVPRSTLSSVTRVDADPSAP